MNDARIYTVTDVTRDIRVILEETFSDVWVEGEITNLTISSAGHMYFSLKDKNSLLNCVMFRAGAARNVFNPEDGMAVLCSGRISVYDKRGQYQLYAQKIEPKGRGSLSLAFEQLKEKLRKEGLFDDARKKTLPFLPRHVGIVTSPSGAAIRDILKVARRRNPNIEISISSVRVQGSEAKDEIARAIGDFNEYNEETRVIRGEYEPVDVIIVTRGGGSLEDLWPFNEEIVARAISASFVPVVSAVGHEIDYTISDFVADFRAPTPSAAAEEVFPAVQDLLLRLKQSGERLFLAVKNKIRSLEKSVHVLETSYVLRAPINVVLRMEQEIDDLNKRAETCLTHLLEIKEGKLAVASGKLDALNPLSVLDRGYSITFTGGKVARNAKDFQKGDLVRTKFVDGIVESKVKRIER